MQTTFLATKCWALALAPGQPPRSLGRQRDFLRTYGLLLAAHFLLDGGCRVDGCFVDGCFVRGHHHLPLTQPLPIPLSLRAPLGLAARTAPILLAGTPAPPPPGLEPTRCTAKTVLRTFRPEEPLTLLEQTTTLPPCGPLRWPLRIDILKWAHGKLLPKVKSPSRVSPRLGSVFQCSCHPRPWPLLSLPAPQRNGQSSDPSEHRLKTQGSHGENRPFSLWIPWFPKSGSLRQGN